ncbi:hypothetical protein C8A05DRAFT_17735 [Staphylotrichum tortipilum]|uniref:UDP-glucose 6-dehydrogenase n=1 Tax=Staphylotrichum tortipilum TaxID=2831512 RepID=A0AAN6MFG0_9PEZI|nr:hypothetical protein C8A05DRAFT_17735 [Staphylotrichum longicolle]
MANPNHSQGPCPAAPSTDRELAHSLPSSQSIASTVSPGTSTPHSWSAGTDWALRSTDPSPLSGGTASPDFELHRLFNGNNPPPAQKAPGSPSRAAAKNICFIGAGFVGGPTAAVIAHHNPHLHVHVVDLNTSRIAAWNSPHLPIHETGLLKIVRIARDGTLDTTVSLPGLARPVELKAREPNLVFSTGVEEAVAEADVVFICVNTPTKTGGLGAGAMADVSAVEGAVRTVTRHARAGTVVVEKSTVPCGTAKMVRDILRHHRPEAEFEVLSNPEFLAEGTAVENLTHPDRILIGSAQTPSGLRAAAMLKDIYAAWVPPGKIVTVNTFSSELAKLVANAMLAQRISSINAVSAMCEEIGLGADVDDVSLAVGKDERLGPKFLQAGVGFGGSCFEKDILNLAYLARELHLDAVAEYWVSILKINEDQRRRFARRVVRELNGSLRGKKIAVLGFAFKDETNDTRNSIAVHIVRDLALELPKEIALFDPGCEVEEIVEEVQSSELSSAEMERVKVCSGWRECLQGSSAVCILTQWKQFRGRQLGASGGAARQTIKLGGHQLDPATNDVCLSETSIADLEKLSWRELSSQSDDPLGRLKPLPPCPADCSGCRLGQWDARGRDMEAVDWVEAADMMEEPRWVFDGRNVVNQAELQELGFKVRGIGKGFNCCGATWRGG